MYKYVVLFTYFSVKRGGGENLVYGSLSSSLMAFLVFYSDEWIFIRRAGFAPPVPPVPPLSSESSVETPVDGRRKCSSCPRRMSKKSADRHTLCVSCRGFDCDLNNRCEECLEQGVHFFRKSCASQMSSFTKCLFLPRSRNSLGRFSENGFNRWFSIVIRSLD